MTRKNKIITAVVGVICFAGLAIGIYFLSINFGTIKKAVTESQQVYTKDQLEAAKLEAYNKALGEKAAYEKTIASLNLQLVEKDKYWQKKYNDMVAEKDSEIARLTKELTDNVAYMRELEKYIMDYFQITLPEGSNTPRAALDLQLAAFTTIKNNLTVQKTRWEETLENLSNEDTLRADITARENDLKSANDRLSAMTKRNRYFTFMDGYIKDTRGTYFKENTNMLTEHGLTKIIKGLASNVGSISVILGTSSSDSASFQFSFLYNESTGEATSNSDSNLTFDTYVVSMRLGWLYEQGVLSGGVFESMGAEIFPYYQYSYVEYKAAFMEERENLRTAVTNAESNLKLAQARFESTIGERAVAEAMLSSATSGIAQAEERIAEIEAEIAKWEEAHPEEGEAEQGGTV